MESDPSAIIAQQCSKDLVGTVPAEPPLRLRGRRAPSGCANHRGQLLRFFVGERSVLPGCVGASTPSGAPCPHSMLEEEDSQMYSDNGFPVSQSMLKLFCSELLDDGNLPTPDYWRQVSRYIGGLGVAAIVIVVLIAVVLFLEIRRREANLPSPARLHKWQTRLVGIPNPSTYQAALKSYTESEHLAGTYAGRQLALWTKAELEKEGISVQLYPYTVLLSYPRFISAKMTYPTEYARIFRPKQSQLTHACRYACAVYETAIPEDPTTADAANMPAYNGAELFLKVPL